MTVFASRTLVPSIACLTSISSFFHCHFSVLVSPSQISLSFDFHCLSHPHYCLTVSLPLFFSCPTGCLTFYLLSLVHLSNAVLSAPFLFVASLLFLLLSMSLRLRHADRLRSLRDARLNRAAVRLANGDRVVTQCRQRRRQPRDNSARRNSPIQGSHSARSVGQTRRRERERQARSDNAHHSFVDVLRQPLGTVCGPFSKFVFLNLFIGFVGTSPSSCRPGHRTSSLST